MWSFACALTMNTLVYTFYRAEMRQDRANWSTLSAMTIAPVLVVAFAPQSWEAVPLPALGIAVRHCMEWLTTCMEARESPAGTSAV